ncbi:MAG TPA: pyridoxal-phosphate dependent enzyme, partial [Clostridia bacterium]|nr:pyridoxal-phosphate dependent enzyme [Clostridia bacterium]
AVPDEAILDAMREMGQKEGVFGEPAGVTSYAGVKQAVAEGIIKRDETVTCICSGSGLKDVVNALKAAGDPIRSRPDLEELERTDLFNK